MARRGTFGRSPRPAQSLANTLVAIAREMQQQQDQNIMDAWNKGGIYEGKKVTDQMVLDHWNQRLKGVSKDDPLYDTYKNAVSEYDYAIHESKMTVAYAQQKISDMDAANFYLKWAKKIPKNSEFWRVLQRDAAQYIRAAQAKVKQQSAADIQKAYVDKQNQLFNHFGKAANLITNAFTYMAQQGGLAGAVQPLITSGSDLLGMGPGDVSAGGMSDPEGIMRLIGSVMSTPTGAGGKRVSSAGVGELPGPSVNTDVLYVDPATGKRMTGQDLIDSIKQADPKFDGNLTFDAFISYLDTQKEGLNRQIKEARKTGHTSDEAAYSKQKAGVIALGQQAQAWTIEQLYLEAYQDKLDVWNDPASGQADVIRAENEFRATCARLAKDPRVQDDQIVKTKLQGQATGNEDTVPLYVDLTGNTTTPPVDAQGRSPIAADNFIVQRATDEIQNVASGAMVWTTGDYVDGIFQPAAGGSVIGAATRDQIDSNSGGVQPIILPMSDKGGGLRNVYVMGQNIQAVAQDPYTGDAVPTTTHLPVGTYYNVPGGQPGSNIIGWTKSDGTQLYATSDNSPFGGRLGPDGSGKMTLVLSVDPNNLTPGFAWQVKGSSKYLEMDPMLASQASLPEHYNAQQGSETGGDPHTDFRSPTMAYYSNYNRSGNISNLLSRPEVAALVDAQDQLATGITYDNAGNIAGGNVNAYQASTQQNTAFSGMQDHWDRAQSLWNRAVPAGNLPGDWTPSDAAIAAATGNANEVPVPGGVSDKPAPLGATSSLSTGFAALGGIFDHGTLNLTQKQGSGSGMATIQSPQTIKVPGIPSQAMNPGPTTTTTTVTTPVVSGGPTPGLGTGPYNPLVGSGATPGLGTSPSGAKQQTNRHQAQL